MQKYLLTLKELKQIKTIARYGKNGKKYVWQNIDYCKTQKLAQKYGIEQISNDILWLQN